MEPKNKSGRSQALNDALSAINQQYAAMAKPGKSNLAKEQAKSQAQGSKTWARRQSNKFPASNP